MIENLDEMNSNTVIEKQEGLFKIGLIPDWLDRIFLKSVTPIIKSFSAGHINPNWITSAGFLLILISAYFILSENFIVAGIFVIIGGVFDFVDGKVAAKTNQTTLFGAIYDSILDRYSDMVICLSLSIYFTINDHFITALVTILALIGSIMTSYIKAIGESHGFKFRAGFLRRQERMTIIIIMLIFSFADFSIKEWVFKNFGLITDNYPNFVMMTGIYFLAIFSNLSAFQRLLKLRSLTKEKDSINF